MKAILNNCELKIRRKQKLNGAKEWKKLNIHLQVFWFKFSSDVIWIFNEVYWSWIFCKINRFLCAGKLIVSIVKIFKELAVKTEWIFFSGKMLSRSWANSGEQMRILFGWNAFKFFNLFFFHLSMTTEEEGNGFDKSRKLVYLSGIRMRRKRMTMFVMWTAEKQEDGD